MFAENIETRRPGRPLKSNNDDDKNQSRKALLQAAKELFSNAPFAKVSTRKIAERAGVNPALIRYYFINKDGLYQQMLVGMAEELQNNIMNFDWTEASSPIEPIVRSYAAMFEKEPGVAKLIFRELLLNDENSRSKVIDLVIRPDKEFVLKFMKSPHFKPLKPGVNPVFLVLHIMGSTVLPYLMKETIEEVEGAPLTSESFEQMIQQSIQFIETAFINQE
ncbi:transcriptional regulator, TetR family protein [Marinomonas sp. MED121]|uniref:TetR/AcrR family transcriptional regulator n=1 Tax=Marinomonas sp. MED121 TaxID=314277 RepID=UPI0000691042|nr:TetR/AcrR family transcriptional regulator [Marinomonas sp. MED121]EAQ67388.1 transcriptional regulator, TetR family protein [Marinomonas sp. MED121]